MLAQSPIIALVCTAQPDAAKAFYSDVLGLRFVEDDGFALIFDSAGTHLRLSKCPVFTPTPYAVLGWSVPDIAAAVAGLAAKGVAFERYGFMQPAQDSAGIWTSPSGAKVAWFKDPDGNVLSLTEFN